MASSRVLGVELLRAKLKALPKAVQTEMQASLMSSANEIVAVQKALVAPNVDSGDLQMSIKAEPFSRGGIGAIIKAGGELTTRPVRAGQSATYDYALANELGTQDMLAQPFFYPAYRQKKTSTRRKAGKALRKAVGKATK